MPKVLIHLTTGLENPTKAALAFLMAKTGLEEGHTVTMFLAGDAVTLLRTESVRSRLTASPARNIETVWPSSRPVLAMRKARAALVGFSSPVVR